MKEPRYVRALRNRKFKGKVDKTLGMCLIEIKEEVPIFILKKENPIIDKLARSERRMAFLDLQLNKGKVLSDKRVRRYVKLAEMLKRDVPQYILAKHQELKKKVKFYTHTGKPKIKNKKSKRKRTPTKYEAYISSPAWEKRKNKYFRLHPRICAVCYTGDFIHLHHAFYGEYGSEKDEHLFPLCQKHHSEFHEQIGKTKKDMIKETLKFIEENNAINK